MEHPHTEEVTDSAGEARARNERDPDRAAEPSEIRPEDATPKEGVEPPEPSEPDTGHVVEEKQESD
jgi:hypothetical protein